MIAAQWMTYGMLLLLVAGLSALVGSGSDPRNAVQIYTWMTIAMTFLLCATNPLPPFRDKKHGPKPPVEAVERE
jgi:hypothetical protein